MTKRSVLLAAAAALLGTQVSAAPYSDERIIITAKGERLLCKYTITAKSRIPRRECLKAEDWEKMSDNQQRGWHEWLFMEGGKCGQPGTC